jgi:hypothetical protein
MKIKVIYRVSRNPPILEGHIFLTLLKVKQSRYRPGVAQRVPGS